MAKTKKLIDSVCYARLRHGFTVIELTITIAVIGILSALTVNSFSDLQKDARDKERASDVAIIGRHFEKYFSSQTPYYPATGSLSSTTLFNGLNSEILRAPGIDNASAMSLVAATNNATTASGVLPQPNKNTYVYQPLTSTGALCSTNGSCTKFNLYYFTERTSTIIKVASQRQ